MRYIFKWIWIGFDIRHHDIFQRNQVEISANILLVIYFYLERENYFWQDDKYFGNWQNQWHSRLHHVCGVIRLEFNVTTSNLRTLLYLLVYQTSGMYNGWT